MTVPENIIFLIDRFLNFNIPAAEVKKDNTFILEEASDGRANDILFANQKVLQKIYDVFTEQNKLKAFSEAEAGKILVNICPDL